MDGADRLPALGDWARARRSESEYDWRYCAAHPDITVRVGLLENSHLSTEWVDFVACSELTRATREELAYVRREVARSRTVSPELHELVFRCGEWEVWAMLLNNPVTARSLVERIAAFTSPNATIRSEFAYLISRAKERLRGG